MKLALAVLGLAVLTAACTKVEAKLPPPDPPPLAMPTAPEPVLVPVTIPDPPPPPAATPATSTPKPTPPRTPAGNATPPVPTPTPTPTVTPEVPPPALQTSTSENLEATTQAMLATAQSDADKLASANLSKGARDQYEIAKRMIELSRGAIKVKNYLFAKEMATKATSILSLLLKSRHPTEPSPLPTAP